MWAKGIEDLLLVNPAFDVFINARIQFSVEAANFYIMNPISTIPFHAVLYYTAEHALLMDVDETYQRHTRKEQLNSSAHIDPNLPCLMSSSRTVTQSFLNNIYCSITFRRDRKKCWMDSSFL